MQASALIEQSKKQIRGLFQTGFFHIFGASTLNRILLMVTSFVLVRILSKEDYGVYAYAFNIVSFFVIFNGLGVTSALMQICSELHENKKKADGVFSYGYRSGITVDLILALIILIVGLVAPLAIKGSNLLLCLFCLYPLSMLLFDIKTIRLRVLLKNHDYALAVNVQSVLLVSFSILGAIFFGTIGLVVGQTSSYLLAYAFLCIRHPFKEPNKAPLERAEKKDFWNISAISAFNNGLSQALTLTGTFFMGSLLGSDSLVASYQVATLIPYGLLFIPGILMTYAYPYFARNNKNKQWTISNYIKLTLVSFVLMGVLSGILALIAEPLIVLLFGEQYLDVVPVFRLLLIGFFVAATFRQIPGNLLVTQRKLIINSVVGIIAIIANIVFSVSLIPQFGMYGAAISYITTMAICAILYTACYWHTILNI